MIGSRLRALFKPRRRHERPAARTGVKSRAAIQPDRVIWLFGAPRTGSTWLSEMLTTTGMTVWHEPMLGALFGNPYYIEGTEALREKRRVNKHWILGRHRAAWLRAIRFTVLNGAAARFPGATDEGFLLIKEPNGSFGAPLLMAAVQESRLILLVRDPRDAIASALDTAREGSWWTKVGNAEPIPADRSAASVQGLAMTFVLHVTNAKKAFDEHSGSKVLVRYEDLRLDAKSELVRIHESLGVPYTEAKLDDAVRLHAWENLPEEQKGPGKFRRRAAPGSWAMDLSDEQVAAVENIAASLIDEFYPGTSGTEAN